MRRERRQPTRAEWERITSSRPVVRRIPKPEKKPRAGSRNCFPSIVEEANSGRRRGGAA
jgi:hypothetical protein